MKADISKVKIWAEKNSWLLLEESEETEESYSELRYIAPNGEQTSFLFTLLSLHNIIRQ